MEFMIGAPPAARNPECGTGNRRTVGTWFKERTKPRITAATMCQPTHSLSKLAKLGFLINEMVIAIM
ncbi:uncharacterized protein H6S33_010552 [Morchella sextelata]|uniref:uncharacterized protein n=1 Tax=Morchella sextelata TaxID=1174677 RepID=UPI001D036491|nr:uncharacterized protein H6S33_010552 [Morchella sextelata]KAH0611287.1 hypothetical protein H6S33_010552 [Morchella sextelata]